MDRYWSLSSFFAFLRSLIFKYKLIILYIEYNCEKYPNSFDTLEKYLKKLINCEIVIVKIDNNIEEPYYEKISNSIVIINGCNTNWEFSGWQKGVDYLMSNKIQYDAILFVNDSFLVYNSKPIETILRPEVLANCINKNAIAGIMDYSNQKMELNGYNVTKYIRTNCFFVARPILTNINSFCSVDYGSMDKYIPPQPVENYFFQDAPINKALQNEIIEWLSVEWHSKFDILRNWDLFRHKTCAIFNEKLLTAKITEKGFNVVNVGEYMNNKINLNYLIEIVWERPRRHKYIQKIISSCLRK